MYISTICYIVDCIEQSLKNHFKNDCMTPWLWSMVYRGQNLSEYRPCSNKDQYLDSNRKFVWSLDTGHYDTCASKCQRAIYLLSFYSFQTIIILNFDSQSHAQQHGSHLNQEFGIQLTICRDGICLTTEHQATFMSGSTWSRHWHISQTSTTRWTLMVWLALWEVDLDYSWESQYSQLYAVCTHTLDGK